MYSETIPDIGWGKFQITLQFAAGYSVSLSTTLANYFIPFSLLKHLTFLTTAFTAGCN